MTLDEFFEGYAASRSIFDALYDAIAALGPIDMRVTKSQVAFRQRRAFARAWVPDRYLGQRVRSARAHASVLSARLLIALEANCGTCARALHTPLGVVRCIGHQSRGAGLAASGVESGWRKNWQSGQMTASPLQMMPTPVDQHTTRPALRVGL